MALVKSAKNELRRLGAAMFTPALVNARRESEEVATRLVTAPGETHLETEGR